MPRIIVSVSNDLTTDKRVKKSCQTLHENGFEILLLGRKSDLIYPQDRPYPVKRLWLIFNKGFLFYAELNWRLFWFLLFQKSDFLYANDLDTLLPNYLVGLISQKKIIYDSHELFTEVPELKNREFVRNFWMKLEKVILPNLKTMITVNSKIGNYYEKKYKIPVHCIRNMPYKIDSIEIDQKFYNKTKGNRKMIILQGAGINIDRGAEEAVLMMKYLEDFILYIIGKGDIFPNLKSLVADNDLNDKIKILPSMPYNELIKYTSIADLGLSLDKGSNLNYEWSLPNKVFDYIQCRIPVMATNRILVAELIQKNNIGIVVKSLDPEYLAMQVSNIFADEKQLHQWKCNLEKVAPYYTWENESKKLTKIFQDLV